jgi:hypothetical protein
MRRPESHAYDNVTKKLSEVMYRIVCGVRCHIVLERKVIGSIMIRRVFKNGVNVCNISVCIYDLKNKGAK